MEASHPVTVSPYSYLEKSLPLASVSSAAKWQQSHLWDLSVSNRQDCGYQNPLTTCTVLCLGGPLSHAGRPWAGKEDR